MKNQTLAKIAVLVVFIVGFGLFIYSKSFKLPEPPRFEVAHEVEPKLTVTVSEYEKVRNRLYDAALNFCAIAMKTDFWKYVDDEHKNVIENYRVPSLNVLLEAIEQMDNADYTCLSDAFDWELCEYDEALYEYNKIARIQ